MNKSSIETRLAVEIGAVHKAASEGRDETQQAVANLRQFFEQALDYVKPQTMNASPRASAEAKAYWEGSNDAAVFFEVRREELGL